MVLQFDVLDHRRRQALYFVRLEFPFNFLRHGQEPLYTKSKASKKRQTELTESCKIIQKCQLK